MERINSRNNPRIKQVVALRDKKNRDLEKIFFFEGAHLLEEYLMCSHTPECVFVTDAATKKYAHLLSNISSLVCPVADEVFEKMSTESAPQGIITLSKRLSNIRFGLSDMNGGCMMLSSVRDAGNVGTVIRTAAAFGSEVIMSADCADIYGYKTVRASMGAVFRHKITVTSSLEDEINLRKNSDIITYAAALASDAVTLSDGLLGNDDCVVVGNEGQGISENIINTCGKKLIIPMEKGAESLNASMAATVLLWEMRRARLGK